jgi:diguanylate cyclase (GGDEF)-like protein/PAS domain S-box-containing protein
MDATNRIDGNDATGGKSVGREHYRVLFERAPYAIAILDKDGLVIRVNEEFSRLFQFEEQPCVGRRIDELVAPTTRDSGRISFSVEAMRHSCVAVEARCINRHGTPVDVSILSKPIDTETGEPAIYIIFQNISGRRKKDEDLRYVAYHDALTGLPNRKAFYDHLDDLLRHSGRRNSDLTWALMFLDLDKFKQVNDALGHDTGDKLLTSVAARLKGCLRETDHLFRLGGDEFTVILTNLNRDIDVARVARKLIATFARPFSLDGHEIFTATSIGISVYPNDGWDVANLVKNADMAMYAAKGKGGGVYRFFTEEMNRKAQYRLKMENALRKALDRKELTVYYQPLVTESRRIVGVEALLRWHHPDMGIILPSDFIRITEETGIIVAVGQWVLQQACAQTKRWHDMGFADLFVSVNLSARQLYETGFEQMVIDTLQKSGLPPNRLKLEVTESSVIQNPELCISKMQNLRSLGVSFAIDDFGTGYSSLSYLKRFPIDSLKIDRSFVADAMNSKGDQEIIKTIIAMARNLNIATVAEGVETSAQKEFLTDHGCESMQGFLFAHPVPVNQIKTLLENQQATGST